MSFLDRNPLKEWEAVADSDLQIRGGGGGPDPEIRGAVSKTFFSALWASVWSKNMRWGWGGGSPLLDPPLRRVAMNSVVPK